MNSLDRFSGYAYALLRVIAGLMFACHGAQKLLGLFGGKGGAEGLMLLGGVIEMAGGLLIALGLLTRPAAFLASGMMAAAYFMAHAAHGPLPIINKGELAVLYCFVFLYIFFRGGGPFSLDLIVFHRESANTVGGATRN